MLSRNTFGFSSTVMLGIVALLGTSTAQAVINLDGSASAESTPAVVFAKETLTKPAIEGSYYVATGADGLLTVQAEAGVWGLTSDPLVVEVMLNGMVFNSAPTMAVMDAVDSVCPDTAPGGAITARQGGAKGDHRAAFYHETATTNRGDPNADTPTTGSKLCLYVDDFGVSASGTGGITFNVKDTLAALPSEYTASYRNAIRVASALKETPAMLMPTATVAHDFMSFNGARAASVGSLWLSYEGDYYDADDGTQLTAAAMEADSNTPDTGRAAVMTRLVGNDDESSVTFSGDFSFATKVTLGEPANLDDVTAGSACDGSGNDYLQRDEVSNEVSDTMELMPIQAAALGDGKHLCIMVADPESEHAVPIPATDSYMVATSYDGASTSSAFVPGGEYTLGYIQRDGTTVRIPYLTTFPDYNQRIVIRNRGGAAGYGLNFHAEDGARATPGANARGMLPANSVTYLSMRHDDLVRLENTFRVAATLTVVSEDRNIDVSVSQTNVNGGTDTVHLTPTDR